MTTLTMVGASAGGCTATGQTKAARTAVPGARGGRAARGVPAARVVRGHAGVRGRAPRTIGAGAGVVARAGARARRLADGANDAGMATAEYAVATLAAVGFAGLLLAILKSDTVRDLLLGIVKSALSVG